MFTPGNENSSPFKNAWNMTHPLVQQQLFMNTLSQFAQRNLADNIVPSLPQQLPILKRPSSSLLEESPRAKLERPDVLSNRVTPRKVYQPPQYFVSPVITTHGFDSLFERQREEHNRNHYLRTIEQHVAAVKERDMILQQASLNLASLSQSVQSLSSLLADKLKEIDELREKLEDSKMSKLEILSEVAFAVSKSEGRETDDDEDDDEKEQQ